MKRNNRSSLNKYKRWPWSPISLNSHSRLPIPHHHHHYHYPYRRPTDQPLNTNVMGEPRVPRVILSSVIRRDPMAGPFGLHKHNSFAPCRSEIITDCFILLLHLLRWTIRSLGMVAGHDDKSNRNNARSVQEHVVPTFCNEKKNCAISSHRNKPRLHLPESHQHQYHQQTYPNHPWEESVLTLWKRWKRRIGKTRRSNPNHQPTLHLPDSHQHQYHQQTYPNHPWEESVLTLWKRWKKRIGKTRRSSHHNQCHSSSHLSLHHRRRHHHHRHHNNKNSEPNDPTLWSKWREKNNGPVQNDEVHLLPNLNPKSPPL